MGFSYAAGARTQVRTGAERATLVRRTYGLVFLSVIVTMLGARRSRLRSRRVMQGVIDHPFITFICMFIPLIMAQRAARDFPKNLILTFLFTFIEGIWLAPFLLLSRAQRAGRRESGGHPHLLGVRCAVAVRHAQPRDFSAWGSFFTVGLVRAVRRRCCSTSSCTARRRACGSSSVGVLVFSGLLVFDTWRILRSGAYGQDDYVIAAVSIYLDLLNMFVFILSLLGGGRRR